MLNCSLAAYLVQFPLIKLMYGQSSPKQGSELAPLGTSWGQGIVHGFHNNVHLAFFIISRLGHHLTSHRAKNTLPASWCSIAVFKVCTDVQEASV